MNQELINSIAEYDEDHIIQLVESLASAYMYSVE